VSVLPDAPHALRGAERVTVHLGTSETPAPVAVRGSDEIPPGGTGRVQLRLARPVAAGAGDRVILRLTAPQTTLAGGSVTDAAPTRSGQPRPAPAAAATPAPARALSDEGAEDLERRLAESPLAPPPLSPADQAPAAYLADAGRIVRAGRDLAFTRAAFDQAQEAAIEIATERGAVTIAELRDRLGCSRRYAQALLEALDAHGITRRVGDERVLRRRARAAAGDPGDEAAS